MAALHRRVFRAHALVRHGWLDDYRRYFAQVFLDNPLATLVPSLVWERNGVTLGFLGVVPRRMTFRGSPIVMAVCSQFAIDPAARGQAGLQMLKRCFEGPQDLTISDEAEDGTRTIWEWCGGDTVLPYSMRWIKPLRPAQLGLSVLARRKSLAFIADASGADARIIDAVIGKLRPPAFRRSPPPGSREELEVSAFVAGLGEAAHAALRPDYDEDSAAWVFARAGSRPGCGPLRKRLIRRARQVLGWFVYSVNRSGIAEVLHLAARPDAAGTVLDHLFDDAMEQRAIAVSGRLDPGLLAPLSAKRALFYRAQHWTLVHTRNRDLRHAVHRGDAILSRFEGEWCVRFP